MRYRFLRVDGLDEIPLLDFGYGHAPQCAHKGDAAFDVYAIDDVDLMMESNKAVPLGFGIELPENTMGLILPRSSLAREGLIVHPAPIDSSYKGEIHAIVTATRQMRIKAGERIAQLVILPIFAPANWRIEDERGTGAFGSSGR